MSAAAAASLPTPPEGVGPPPLQAWRLAGSAAGDGEDRCAERRGEPVALASLASLGLAYRYLPVPDGVAYPERAVPWVEPEAGGDAAVQAMREELGMSYADIVTIHHTTLPDYERCLERFYEEHIHTDDEVRYILEGSGYFDVRTRDQEGWVRVRVAAGQCIVVPAGIYHRFTLDAGQYAKAMRLFAGEPVWTPINRGDAADEHPVRRAYLATYGAAASSSQP